MKEKRKRSKDYENDEIGDEKERHVTENLLKEYKSLSPNIVHNYICDRFVSSFPSALMSSPESMKVKGSMNLGHVKNSLQF
jgi:hypothetical protein